MEAFKCPNCGGDIRYDIEKEAVSCVHCGSIINRDIYQDYLNKNQKYIITELECPQCGASVLSYDDTLSSFCSYCGASITFTKQIIESGKPDGIIPFKITKEEAVEKYKEHVFKSYFAPNYMMEDCEQKTIGIYIPYYVYGGNATGHYNTTGKRQYNNISETVIEEYKLDFDLDANYEGTRFDASKTFPDSMSESIDTYNLEESKEFETSYLAGFYSDNGDTDKNDYSSMVEKLIISDVKSNTDYEGIKINMSSVTPDVEIESKKVLFPVWLNTHKKNDRVFYSAINGENGDVASELPIDKWKYLKISLIMAGYLFFLLNLFFTIKPNIFIVIAGIILFIFGIFIRKVTGDVYVREHHLDDIGLIGYDKFNSNVKIEGTSTSQSNKKANWKFKVPAKVSFMSWWKTLVGLLLILGVWISGTNLDYVYYIVAGINIVLAIWSAFTLIKQQNKLASREIPIFTRKRGGDDNG